MTPWTLELREDGDGATTWVEDSTKEMTRSASRAKAKAKAKAREIVTTVDRQRFTQESAPTRNRAKAKATDSKEMVATAARRAIPRGSARKAKKEESQKERRQLQGEGQRIAEMEKIGK